MGSAEVEIELKLRADTDEPLRALEAAARLGPATLARPRRVAELDRYLDTPDGRLAAARWACRLRSRDGRTWASLKGPAQHAADDALHRRPEAEGPVGDPRRPRSWPASAARDLVLELAGEHPLIERVALQQERIERAALVAGRRLATLSLDRVQVRRGDDPLGALRVVELELAGHHSGPDVDALLNALLAVPGLEPEPASKLERALTLLAARDARRRA